MSLRSLKNFDRKKLENTEIFIHFQRKLKEDKWYTPVLDYTEGSTNVDRVYLVTATVFALLAALVVNYGLELICGSVGFLYPAYKTIASLEKTDNDSTRRWLRYWVVFSAFNFLQIFLFFLYWLPGYWLIKSLFYYWCYAPISRNGSEMIYSYLIQPFYKRNQETIDDALKNIVKTAHTVYTESDEHYIMATSETGTSATNTDSKMDLSSFKYAEFVQGKDDFRYYFRRFELELRVFRITHENDKRDLILRCMGSTLFKLVNDHFDPTSPDEIPYADITSFLESYFKPTTNIHAERTKFSQRFRRHGETVAEYVAALRALAVNCKFKTTLDERLRDQVILGINDSRIQELLFREHPDDTATLNEVEKSASNYESALLNRATIESVIKNENSTASNDIHKIKSQPNSTPKKLTFHKSFSEHAGNTQINKSENSGGKEKKFLIDKHQTCIRCGNRKHSKGEKCRAELAICKACKLKGHYEKVCVRSGKAEFVNHIYRVQQGSKYEVKSFINYVEINFQYDTGSSASLIPQCFYKQIGQPKILKAKQLYAYPYKPIKTVGDINVNITIGTLTKPCRLTLVPGNSTPILGKDLMKLFELEPNYEINYVLNNTNDIQTALLKEYSEVFDQNKIGTIKGFEADIKLAPDSKPVLVKARPVPYALKLAADREIDRLIKNGTLEYVDATKEKIEYASPVVYVTKRNDEIRLCSDFKSTINKNIIKEQYPYPTFDDIVTKLNGCVIFSVIDLKDAFLQVKIKEQSRKYLVIATHRGYYRYCRMPFGISVAPIIFEKLMDQFLIGIEGVTWFQDDIAVGGRSIEELEQRLRKVFDLFRTVRLTTQVSKLQLFKSEIKFLGHIISKDGVLPDKERIRALNKQPAPSNISELRSFLGSVNYYSRFVKNLQALCAPLYELLTKSSTWNWTEKHQKCFEEVRKEISSPGILAHFDPSKPIVLACDSSSRGVGAVLQHRIKGELKLIAAASRTLNPAEQNYSSIDREVLAIMFGLQKFYKYLIGNHFTIQSDHKPLERILGPHREIPRLAASRLTRWAVTLGAFDYELEHRPGEQMCVPDALSRFPLPEKKAMNTSREHPILQHSDNFCFVC